MHNIFAQFHYVYMHTQISHCFFLHSSFKSSLPIFYINSINQTKNIIKKYTIHKQTNKKHSLNIHFSHQTFDSAFQMHSNRYASFVSFLFVGILSIISIKFILDLIRFFIYTIHKNRIIECSKHHYLGKQGHQ